jgi:DNA polymerase-3 subunit delta
MSNFDKALKSRVVLIAGDEDILRREALAGMMSAVGLQPDDFDLELFAGDASNPADWAASAGTSPFLAERRTVIVRHLLRCDPEKLKGTDFGKLPPTSLLILVADEEGGSDEKAQRTKTQRKVWEKVVTAAGGTVLACDSNPKTLRESIKKRAAEMGKSISDKAIETLGEMTGGSLSRALDELDKVYLYTSGQEQIRESDVRTVVVPSRDWNVYKMVDSILAGEVAEALRQLRVLVGSATKAEDAAFSRILPTVGRQLRMLWQARLCIDANCAPGNAPESIRALFPDKPNLAAEPPYRQGAVMSTARRISLERLERCFEILADTDARLKGALDGFSGIETLERMVLEMAEATSARRAA